MPNTSVFSRQIARAAASIEAVTWFMNESPYPKLVGKPGVNDFALGNPHEMPLPGLTEAFQKWIVPQNKDWFAYKMNEPESRQVIGESLQKRFNIPFEPEDIMLTSGAFGALSVALRTIIDPEDEIIYISPPWFFYVPMIISDYGVPVRVQCDPVTYDLDLGAIEHAITPKTRGIIINTPNNPTGRIYSMETLQGLSQLLKKASQRIHRTIYLISDESYNHILYDDRPFYTPSAYYPHTFLVYTYGKTLLAPGQRIGYIAMSPAMENREPLRAALFTTQMLSGYSFPNALLHHALPDLENLSIDLLPLQNRRDRMVRELRGMGYSLRSPEGTFYLLIRSPIPDDLAFVNLLGEENILCLPGKTFEMPGYFRISLTANDEMVNRALPGFARAFERSAVRAKAA